jgi:hypothetical protein
MPSAPVKLEGDMKPTKALHLCRLILVVVAPLARAGDGLPAGAAKLGEHPAVLVSRKAPHADPTASFYLHPARLSWTLQRPLSDGEHPAVLVARHEPKIDPNRFILGHPAGGAPGSQTQ